MMCNGLAIIGSKLHMLASYAFFTCPYDGTPLIHAIDAVGAGKNIPCGWGSTWPSVPVILAEVAILVAIFLMCRYLRCDARMWKWKQESAAAEVSSDSAAEDAMECESPNERRLLHTRFVRHAADKPNATALIYGDKGQLRMSYKELQHAALQTAFLLVDKHNVKPCARTPIGISAEGENFYKAALGVVQTGNPYIPLTIAWPVQQLTFILEDASIPIVLVDQDAWTQRWSQLNRKEVVNLKEAEKITVRAVNWNVREDDLAYVLYTSGSTGHPKGVLAPHRCYYTRLKWMWNSLPIEAGEVGIHKTVPIWVDHIQEVFGYLGGGIPIVIASPEARKDPQMLNTLCRDHRVSRIVVVPSLLRLFMSMHQANGIGQELPNLRTWITSGEPLTTETLKTFLASAPGAKLVNTYGSTEVAGDVTWVGYDSNSSLPEGEFVPIGKPMPGVKLHILNPETLEPVEASKSPKGSSGELQDVGEMVVEGDFVAEGYLNRPEEQKKGFIEIPHLKPQVKKAFRTGDFARVGAGGNIEYHGRQDQQVKVHGQRVEVLHVEQVLKNSLQSCLEKAGKADKMVPLAIIMAVKSKIDTGSYDLHAFIETGETDSALARVKIEEVKERMQQELMPAHVPESFWKEAKLPRLPNSKIDRKRLKELAEEKGAEQEFSKEVDSFGNMRKIAVEYSDSRRAINICNIWCLFHVVTMHLLGFWLGAGVVPNVPIWLRIAEGYWDAMEDVWMLMAGVALTHAMGGEEKYKMTLLEPGILGVWFVGRHILPPAINFFGMIFTGLPLFKCTGKFTALVYCPTSGHLYFLVLLFWARMLVIGWHFAVTSRFRPSAAPLLNGVLCGLSVLFAAFGWLYPLPIPALHQVFLPFSSGGQDEEYGSTHLYITLYLVCFYFGYRLLPKRDWIRGPWQVMSPLFFLAYIVGSYILCELVIFPPFDARSHNLHHIIGFFANVVPFAFLFLSFLVLPPQFNIRISGIALLCVYVLHEELKNFCLLGIRIHGLKVFPSLPDIVYSAGSVVATKPDVVDTTIFKSMVAGGLQLFVIVLYHVGIFAMTPYLLMPFSYLFDRISDLCRRGFCCFRGQ
jgi:amino acid adenylation domain-containing protein